MKRIVSGIQPTGHMHIGNYLGAINNWKKLQEEYESFFFIADLHAITTKQNPEKLRKMTLNIAATYIACGLNTKNSTIFIQSSVNEHSELAWMLSCQTPIGWLNRMIQFKEKKKKKKNINTGIYLYPILMASDILLYDATHVPVGTDQKQHIELAKEIAKTINKKYKENVFTIPKEKILKNANKIMSLRNSEKMSKSNNSNLSRINLSDSPDEIKLKIKKAKTDSFPIPENPENLNNRPEVLNLINIYSSITNLTKEKICKEFSEKNFSTFKKSLTEALIEKIIPIEKRRKEIEKETKYLNKILKNGEDKAKNKAQKKIKKVKEIFGIHRIK